MLAAALVLYFDLGYEWWLLVLLRAPDLSALGFLAGRRVGTTTYDFAHLEALPLALAVAGYLGDSDVALKLGLIWSPTSAWTAPSATA